MRCHKCNNELENGLLICPKCGSYNIFNFDNILNEANDHFFDEQPNETVDATVAEKKLEPETKEISDNLSDDLNKTNIEQYDSINDSFFKEPSELIGNNEEITEETNINEFEPLINNEEVIEENNINEFEPLINNEEITEENNQNEFEPLVNNEEVTEENNQNEFEPLVNNEEVIEDNNINEFEPLVNNEEVTEENNQNEFEPLVNNEEVIEDNNINEFEPLVNNEEVIEDNNINEFEPLVNNEEVIEDNNINEFEPLVNSEEVTEENNINEFEPLVNNEEVTEENNINEFEPLVNNEEVIEENNQNEFEPLVNNEEVIEENNINEFEPLVNNEEITEENNQNLSNKLDGTFLTSRHFNKNIHDKPKTQNLKYKIIIVIVVLLSLLVTIGITNYFSPKNSYVKAINQLYNFTTENLKKDATTISGKMNGDAIIKDKQKGLSNWKFQVDYGIDYQNEIANFDVNSKYNNKIVNGSYNLQNGKLYRNLKTIDTNYVNQPLDNFKQLFNLNNKEIVTVSNSINKAFKHAIKNKYIIENKAVLKINTKEEVTQNTLSLSESKFMINFLTNLSEDQDFLNSYSKIKGISLEDLKIELQKMIFQSKRGSSNFNFELYTKGLLKENVGFKLNYEGEETYLLEVIKIGKNNYSFTYNSSIISNQISGNIKYSKKDNYLELTTNIDNDGKNTKANIKIKNDYNKKIPKNKILNSIPQYDLKDNVIKVFED